MSSSAMASSSKLISEMLVELDPLLTSPDRWFELGTHLPNVEISQLKVIESNHGQNPKRCLIETLSCWDQNDQPSWDKLAQAVDKLKVFDKLASSLRSKFFCRSSSEGSGSDSGYESRAPISRKRRRVENEVSKCIRIVCTVQGCSKKKIMEQFGGLVIQVLRAVEGRVSVKELSLYLKNAFEFFKEINEAEYQDLDMKDFFHLLTKRAWSWFNFEVVEGIVKQFNCDKDTNRALQQYKESFKAFLVSRHLPKGETEIHLGPTENGDSYKLSIKVEREWESLSFNEVEHLREQFAEILDIKKQDFVLESVSEGCIMMRFIVPQSVAKSIFAGKSCLTYAQKKALADENVVWLSCGSFKWRCPSMNHRGENPLTKIEVKNTHGLTIGEPLSAGAYGTVYGVAVNGVPRIAKRLHSVLMVPEDRPEGVAATIKRFEDECLLLRSLDYPNVVWFIGVHYTDSVRTDLSLIMEGLTMNLEQYLDPKTRPNIPLSIKLSTLCYISRGLLYLHSQNPPIIHCDLTAGNTLLTKDDMRAKIADLGVSKLLHVDPNKLAKLTTCPDALAYMPHEVLMDNPVYDTQLDVFSYGILLIQDIAAGLHYLHSQNPPIVHRELSARNVLLTKGLQAKFTNLGVSKISDLCELKIFKSDREPNELTKRIAYIPPEALTSMRNPEYNPQCIFDIFSFCQLALYAAIQEFPKAFDTLDDPQLPAASLENEVHLLKRKMWIFKLPKYVLLDAIDLIPPAKPDEVKCFLPISSDPGKKAEFPVDMSGNAGSEKLKAFCVSEHTLVPSKEETEHSLYKFKETPITEEENLQRDESEQDAAKLTLTDCDIDKPQVNPINPKDLGPTDGLQTYPAHTKIYKERCIVPLAATSNPHRLSFPEYPVSFNDVTIPCHLISSLLKNLDHVCEQLAEILDIKDIDEENLHLDIEKQDVVLKNVHEVCIMMKCSVPRSVAAKSISSEKLCLTHVWNIVSKGGFRAVYRMTADGVPRIAMSHHNVSMAPGDRAEGGTAITKRFEDECHVLSYLNLVRTDSVHTDLSLIMECLYTNMEQYLDPKSHPNIPLPIKGSVRCVFLTGMLCLHRQNPPIIHCDLTAGNILLMKDLLAKITDLGVSNSTPAYMPPGVEWKDDFRFKLIMDQVKSQTRSVTSEIVLSKESMLFLMLLIAYFKIFKRDNVLQKIFKRNNLLQKNLIVSRKHFV